MTNGLVRITFLRAIGLVAAKTPVLRHFRKLLRICALQKKIVSSTRKEAFHENKTSCFVLEKTISTSLGDHLRDNKTTCFVAKGMELVVM